MEKNINSICPSPEQGRGALVRHDDATNSSGSILDPQLVKTDDLYTGPLHSRRLRRMRRVRRKQLEQRRMATNSKSNLQLHGQSSPGDESAQIGPGQRSTPAEAGSDGFGHSDEERIIKLGTSFIEEKKSDNKEGEKNILQQNAMQLCNSSCNSEDELEYGLEKTDNEHELILLQIQTEQQQFKPQFAPEFNTIIDNAPLFELPRMRGQHQPLVIAIGGNARQDKWLIPKNYKVYGATSPQYNNSPVYFYLEPKSTYGRYNTIPFNPSNFAIMVTTLRGNLTHRIRVQEADYLYVSQETGKHGGPFYQKRFRCSFEPIEPGLYPVTVCLSTYGHVWNPQHVDGSPLNLIVEKNFELVFKNAINIKLPRSTASGVRATTSSAVHGKKSPFKRQRQSTRAQQTSARTAAPTAAGMTVMEVTRHNEMCYYNHKPILATNALVSTTELLPNQIKPWGITFCSKTGELFVTTRELHQIQRYSSTTAEYLGHFGSFGSHRGCFFRPTGIVYDQMYERLIITDKDNHRVCFYTVTGQFIGKFGSNGHRDGHFNYPWGVDVTKDGSRIAVADSRNHRVQLFAADGTFVCKYSVFETNPFEYKDVFNYPRGVCFDNAGKYFYVSDFNTNRVVMLNINCTTQIPLTTRGLCLRPQGLTVDDAGNIIICDTRHRLIRVMGTDQKLVASFEGLNRLNENNEDDQDYPLDVCMLNSQKMAVLTGNGFIRIF